LNEMIAKEVGPNDGRFLTQIMERR
jgi:hypothetical protein